MAITPVKTLVKRAKEEIRSLSVQEVQRGVEAGEVLLIDIRDVRELDREGRIPGAFHAPRGMLEFWFDPESPYHKTALVTEKTKVLFCASSWRSALAAKALQEMGVENVTELSGGFTAWRDQSGEIDS
jgi:rhodanese-related sulfurtransferase